jgi:hypothetical protein
MGSFMRHNPRTMLAVLLGSLAAIRLALFLVYSAPTVLLPFETHALEAKMVHLAWRYQHGLSLYPDWTSGPPYVCNFFGPLAFVLVGWIGRAMTSSLDALFVVGRLVSLAASLGTAVVVGLASRSRYGREAGFVAGLLVVGSAPDVGFSVMTRPDALADLLGLAGFLLAIGRSRTGGWVGVSLLAAGVLTKQTSVVYILAAGLGLLLDGRARQALTVTGGSAALLAIAIGLGTLVWEPRLAGDLAGESGMAWNLGEWQVLLLRLARGSPDLILLSLAGLCVWTRRDGDRPLAALAVVAIGLPLVAMAKHGADVNYALPWRGVAALGAASLLGRGHSLRPRAVLAVGLAAAAAVGLTGFDRLIMARQAIALRQFLHSPPGRGIVRSVVALEHSIERGEATLLTDDSALDIRQGADTLFADPWLFRAMVNDGRIRPDPVALRIEQRAYTLVVTRHDLFADTYADYAFGLPMALARPLRTHYRPAGRMMGLYLYEPMAPAGAGGDGP